MPLCSPGPNFDIFRPSMWDTRRWDREFMVDAVCLSFLTRSSGAGAVQGELGSPR